MNRILDKKPKIKADATSSDMITVKLVLEMTQSAFGHEYTLMNLSDDAPYSERQSMMGELEEHRQRYLRARKALSRLNPDKLSKVEKELQYQKETILRTPQVIH